MLLKPREFLFLVNVTSEKSHWGSGSLILRCGHFTKTWEPDTVVSSSITSISVLTQNVVDAAVRILCETQRQTSRWPNSAAKWGSGGDIKSVKSNDISGRFWRCVTLAWRGNERIRRSFLACQVGAPTTSFTAFAHQTLRDREREEGFRTPPLTPLTIRTANNAGIDECAPKDLIKETTPPGDEAATAAVLLRLQRPVVTWLQSKPSFGLALHH